MSADLPCYQAKYPVFFHPSAVKKKFRNMITLGNSMQSFLLNVFLASRSQYKIPQMIATFHPKLTSFCFGCTWLYLSFVQLTKGSEPGYACNKSQCCQIQPLKTISSDVTKINSFFLLLSRQQMCISLISFLVLKFVFTNELIFVKKKPWYLNIWSVQRLLKWRNYCYFDLVFSSIS